MTQATNTLSSPASPGKPSSKHRVNWHEAASCAVQIELRDYADILDFQTEYSLGNNSYRIDLLVIRKLSEMQIPKNIARHFKNYNLFEAKGFHSSLTVSAYYKTVGYAGLLVDQLSGPAQYSSLNVSLSFLTFRYPRKLIKHLQNERNLTVANSSPGIYDIFNETFMTQIIVTQMLPPEENLYLRCLTNSLTDASLASRLADDCSRHWGQDIYTRYVHQLTTAHTKTKGANPMICEGLFNLFGTSSEEIISHAKKESEEYYLPKINELAASNDQLISSNNQLASSNNQLASSVTLLSSQVDYLKNLLKQNNISFDLESAASETNAPNQ